jgi:ribose transport system ATP-binding protein
MADNRPERRRLIEARGLTKVFDGVTVLKDVDLDIWAGEIQGLVGANGSGKSTLIKILSGYHKASGGRVAVFAGPQDVEPTLAVVHQDLGLVESMSVMEYIALSCGYSVGAVGRIRWKQTRAEVEELLADFGLASKAASEVGSLGGTERRLIAIARATRLLGTGSGVLVLDEPTAGLPSEETHEVFKMMNLIAERGAGVLFVSHNLEETLAVATTVTVLRDGQVVARVRSDQSSVEALASYMFGFAEQELDGQRRAPAVATSASRDPSRKPTTSAPALRVTELTGTRVAGITLDVWPGEIVGVTGLVECGKSELGRILAGAQQPLSGSVSVRGGPPTTFKSPRQALDSGVAYVPPDRRRSGGVLTMSACENVTLSSLNSFCRRGLLRKGTELRAVAAEISQFRVVPGNPKQMFYAFSGGNQQKLVFARVVRLMPSVIILDDPTQGVDVGTIPELYGVVRRLAAEGTGIVLITSDVDELVALAKRIVVLHDGRIDQELRGEEVTAEYVGFAIAGRRSEGVS